MRHLKSFHALALACLSLAMVTADDSHYIIQQLRAVIEQQRQALASQERILSVLQPFMHNSSTSQAAAPSPIVHTIDQRHMTDGPERLFYIENMFSQAEIDGLLSDASSKFKRSETIGAEEEGGVKMVDSRPVRRSDTAYILEDQASPKIMESIERMHQVARLPLEYGEELQVTRYSKGDYYQFHWDSHFSVGRAVTVLVFLNTVKNGGHTIFPGAKWKQGPATRRLVEGVLRGSLPPAGSALWSTSGLPPLGENHQAAQPDMQPFCDHPGLVRIPPVAGNAIMWFNHDPELDLDWSTLHGGCPPKGAEEKYIAQRWMRWYNEDENNFYSIMKECGVIED